MLLCVEELDYVVCEFCRVLEEESMSGVRIKFDERIGYQVRDEMRIPREDHSIVVAIGDEDPCCAQALQQAVVRSSPLQHRVVLRPRQCPERSAAP